MFANLTRFCCALIASALVSCAHDPTTPSQNEVRCPAPQGEFAPAFCAVVRGSARNANGAILTSHAVRVDSAVATSDIWWASSADSIDPDGRFELTVYQYDPAYGEPDANARSIEVKLLASATPLPGATPLAAIAVPMRFARMGERVEPTVVELVFPITP